MNVQLLAKDSALWKKLYVARIAKVRPKFKDNIKNWRDTYAGKCDGVRAYVRVRVRLPAFVYSCARVYAYACKFARVPVCPCVRVCVNALCDCGVSALHAAPTWPLLTCRSRF